MKIEEQHRNEKNSKTFSAVKKITISGIKILFENRFGENCLLHLLNTDIVKVHTFRVPEDSRKSGK